MHYSVTVSLLNNSNKQTQQTMKASKKIKTLKELKSIMISGGDIWYKNYCRIAYVDFSHSIGKLITVRFEGRLYTKSINISDITIK